MASPELQPTPPRGPEFRPDMRFPQTPEVSGRSVEAAPASANLAPAPSPAPVADPADHSQPAPVAPTHKRSMVNLGRSTVKLPERADAGRAVFVDQTMRAVSEYKEDPARQKDEFSRIKEASQEFEGSVAA